MVRAMPGDCEPAIRTTGIGRPICPYRKWIRKTDLRAALRRRRFGKAAVRFAVHRRTYEHADKLLAPRVAIAHLPAFAGEICKDGAADSNRCDPIRCCSMKTCQKRTDAVPQPACIACAQIYECQTDNETAVGHDCFSALNENRQPGIGFGNSPGTKRRMNHVTGEGGVRWIAPRRFCPKFRMIGVAVGHSSQPAFRMKATLPVKPRKRVNELRRYSAANDPMCQLAQSAAQKDRRPEFSFVARW